MGMLSGWLLAGFLLSISSMQAGEQASGVQPVLVELFTSEGCSSCPPADALLATLDRQQGIPGAHVIVLSEHVDYWDHEGWRDRFSSPEITARQTAYGSQFSQPGIYTPEAVIDGARGMNGSDARGIAAAIEDAAKHPKLAIGIADLSVAGGAVEAHVTAGAAGTADLYAALADDRDRSDVLRGENSGHTLEHVAVVRVLKKAGSLKKGFDQKIRIALPGGKQEGAVRLVMFAEDRWTGHIVGVAEAQTQ